MLLGFHNNKYHIYIYIKFIIFQEDEPTDTDIFFLLTASDSFKFQN